jgi:hypothetical protein
MMKKLLLVLNVLCILVMCGWTYAAKRSFKPAYTLDDVYNRNAHVSFDESSMTHKKTSYSKLYESSDLIVKGVCKKVEGYRLESVLREFQVSKLYKGKCGEFIDIYEPSSPTAWQQYFVIDGYLNMENNHEYVLFLKKCKYQNKYYINKGALGKYTDRKESLFPYKDNKDYYYNDIKGREAVIVYRDDLKLYNQVVSKISKWK